MSDIEGLVTEHLTRAAARAEPQYDLDRVFAASELAVSPLPARTAKRRRWRRTIGVAAVLLAIAGVVGLVRSADSARVSTTGDDQASRGARAPTSTAPPSVELRALQPLPDTGFAVIDQEEVRLYDPAGTLVAQGGAAAATREWPGGEVVVDSEPGQKLSVTAGSDEAGYANRGLAPDQDCVALDGSSLGSVETCRTSASDAFGRQLVHVSPDGTRRTLLGAVYPGDVYPGGSTAVAGHWAGAELSPDGRWIAAQWSGECEVPTAFLVRVEDAMVFGPTGAPLAPAVEDWPAESTVLGWDGGRALVALLQGACGSAPRSAVVSVDPDTGSSTELVALTVSDGIVSDRVLAWRRAT
jgi:hypothetical protein